MKDYSFVGISVSIILAILSVFIKKIIPAKVDSRKSIFYLDIIYVIMMVLAVWIFYLIYYLSIFLKVSILYKEENLNMVVLINTVISFINIIFSIGAMIITIHIIIMLKNNFKIIILDNEVYKNKTFGKSYLNNMLHVEKKVDIESDLDRLKNNHKDVYSIKSYTMKDDQKSLIEKIFVYDKSLWVRLINISSKRDDKKYPHVSLLMYLIAIFIFSIINILITILVKSEGYEWLFTILNLANVVVLIVLNSTLINERTHINIRNLEDQKRYIEKEELKFK
ncbi:hypothetical protein MUA77_00345 [Mammaliicoccus sciuri]|uniref:hypothetical protein n=1 Tax=Mammaliicoccus sciuri TaxID=1296 RepID=UPI0021D155A4|nr:hypothetical protein [Mammaliicoccus sciuri]UXU83924.1 hypothetical protein MUA77_00345 [Mammaliicoccus sciuri]UXU93771.1 hypothetical protein MUA42_00345 [Mammaliicoccus sciuri]UXV15719.1 hypothetical protein MUA89_00345 [Mammaliicoccus sciuri]UXV23981.1 hypothetical protein MUA49_00345 [Mammaliicoccus sciuri]UXV26762.1 hypothetical protein MUA96_00345 [Mammaliicoccus sciuri]